MSVTYIGSNTLPKINIPGQLTGAITSINIETISYLLNYIPSELSLIFISKSQVPIVRLHRFLMGGKSILHKSEEAGDLH